MTAIAYNGFKEVVLMNVRIQTIRESKGVSRAELARKSKVALSHLNSIESGEKSPTIRILEKIAKALEVPITDLLDNKQTA
jgi:transcriptional regulator with XRE-family HTH domain